MSSPAESANDPADSAAHPDPDAPLCSKPAGAPEFTLRAIITGLVVTVLVAASYPYVVMKLGFGPNISVVSAFFGYLILGLLFRFAARGFNRWENNIIQTAGTAGGQTAFLCVLMAAFDYLRADPTTGFHFALTPMQSFLWLTTAGTLGALLAVPMRQHFVVDEKLRFADGVAVAETLVVLDSRGPAAVKATIALVIGLVISAKDALWIAIGNAKDAFYFSARLHRTGVGVSFSWLSFGSGMLVGMRINASMLLGAIASWVVAPYLLVHYGVVGATYSKRDVLGWVMWPATGMLVAGGLAALIFRWRVMTKTFKQLSSVKVSKDDFSMRQLGIGVALSAAALVAVQHFVLHMPAWQTVIAIILTVPLMLVGLRVLGETNWGPISALSNLMQGVFAFVAPGAIQNNLVSSGVTGSVAVESEALMQDFKTGHLIGSTPKKMTYMQLLAVPVGALVVSYMYPLLRDTYGLGAAKPVEKDRVVEIDKLVVPGHPDQFLPSESLAKVHEGDTLALVASIPTKVRDANGKEKDEYTHAELKVKSIAGNTITLEQPIPEALRTGKIWWRIDRNADGGLSSPISQKWSGFAKVLSQGWGALPKGAPWGLLVGVLLGIAFTAMEQDKRIKRFTPSPTGVGIGMLVPADAIITMFLGGCTEWLWTRMHKKSSEAYVIPLASGFIAGDAIVYTILPIVQAVREFLF